MRESGQVIGEGREDVNTIARLARADPLGGRRGGDAAPRRSSRSADTQARDAERMVESMDEIGDASRRATPPRSTRSRRPSRAAARRRWREMVGVGRGADRGSPRSCASVAAPLPHRRGGERRERAGAPRAERLLAFEVGGGAATRCRSPSVAEVAEVGELAVQSRRCRAASAASMNHHGDALPVRAPRARCSSRRRRRARRAAARAGARTRSAERPARLGLPVDRILGLVDGPAALARGPDAGRGAAPDRRARRARAGCAAPARRARRK